jgi:hypothetical protein
MINILFIDQTDRQPIIVWIGAGVSALVLLAALAAGIFVIFWKKRIAKPENQMTLMTSKKVIFCKKLLILQNTCLNF